MGKLWNGMLVVALAACGPVEKSGRGGGEPAAGELPEDGIEVADVRPDQEPEGPGRLRGRLDEDGGYQPNGQLPQGTALMGQRARLVDLRGQIKGESAVGADGRFAVRGVGDVDEMSVLEIFDANERAGQVLVVAPLTTGGDVVTLPVSVETSVEVGVYQRLVAEGHAVDPIEVSIRITPGLAAACDVDALAYAVWQAHQAFTLTLGSGVAFDAHALTVARRGAWADLATDLDAGHPEAWPNFMVASMGSLRALGVDRETAFLAELAAGAALAGHLDDDACRAAGLAAAADQTARVGGATVNPWVAGQPYAAAIQIEALGRLAVDLAEVEDAADVVAAEFAITGSLRGPVLTALIAGDEDGLAVAEAVLAVALEARADMEAAVGHGGDAIAQAALALEARVDLALAGLARDDLRGWLRAAAPWVAACVTSVVRHEPPVEEPPVEEPPVGEEPPAEEPPVEEPPAEEPPPEEPPVEEPPVEEPPVEEPPVEEPPVVPGIIGRLVGTVAGGARGGVLGGALGLLDGDGGWLQALRGCDGARLVALGPDGERRILGEGAAANGRWHIDVLAEGEGAIRVVELLRGDVVIGGRILAAGEGIDGECAPVDAESSVEARVVLALSERGVEADLCLVGRLIDGAVAFAVRGQADVDVLADAIEASQLAYAQILGADRDALNAGCAMSETQWQNLQNGGGDGLVFYGLLRAATTALVGADAEDQARATAAGCGAFTGLLRDRLGNATLVLAAEARARLEDAIATNAACGDALDLDLRALIAATAEAGDGRALAAAGADFHAALMGDEGLMARVVADAGGLLAGIVARLLGQGQVACEDHQGRLTAALHAAVALDAADARAAAVVAAYARAEDDATRAGLDVFALLGAADRSAAARVLAYAVVGRYDGPR